MLQPIWCSDHQNLIFWKLHRVEMPAERWPSCCKICWLASGLKSFNSQSAVSVTHNHCLNGFASGVLGHAKALRS